MGSICLKESWNRWGSRFPHEKGQFWGRSPIVKYGHFLPWMVQKRLNRSICRLGCGLGCAKGSTSSVVFARWRQCAIPCGHIGPTWQIRLNHPSAVATQSYVKLLWPLVIYYYTKLHLDLYSHFCTAHGRQSLHFTTGHHFPPKNCSFCRDLDPHVIHGSFSKPEYTSQTTSRWV